MAASPVTVAQRGHNGLQHSHLPFCGSLGHSGLALGPEIIIDSAAFRFLGLPAELRLVVYSELLERKDPDSSKRLYPQILATSKEVHREASPELYTKTSLRLTIEATALKSRDRITTTSLHIGRSTTPLLESHDSSTTISAWQLYSTLPAALGKISNITLQIALSSNRHKGLLKPLVVAEQFNQVHQILTALTATWRGSGTLRTLNIEFLDETGSVQVPPSPPTQMAIPAAREMEESELQQLFFPLCGFGGYVIIGGSSLPSAVMVYLAEHRVTSVPCMHAFEVYASLAARVEATVTKFRGSGQCCTQIGSQNQKPCGIRSLEKKMAIVRDGIESSRIGSQRDQEGLAMDLEALSEFLESKKVQDLVSKAGDVPWCLAGFEKEGGPGKLAEEMDGCE